MGELTLIGGVPVIIGLVELFKQLNVPNRILPVVDVVLGILWALAVVDVSLQAVLQGIILGLSAAGLYRSTKVLVSGE